jgi:hypothetical protein
MNSGHSPVIYLTTSQLKRCTKEQLIRLAKWEGLKYDLDNMSNRQLSRLIRWKITRVKPHLYGG